MIDFKLSNELDIVIQDGDFAATRSLETTLIGTILLQTRVSDDKERAKGGFINQDNASKPMTGSTLHSLRQGKVTAEYLSEVSLSATNALNNLIATGLLDSFGIDVGSVDENVVIAIEASSPTDQNIKASVSV